MESLVKMFSDIYRGKRVLVTGHTGFKGAWLTLWLEHLGAKVFGISLPDGATRSHLSELYLNVESQFLDIRDEQRLTKAIKNIQPDVIFHLAAFATVVDSYSQPLDVFSTNIIGSANVLEACRSVDQIQAIVMVTTDKCYENKNWLWGYREDDRLGGIDPYSASKASAELVINSYRKSFFKSDCHPLIATARAGNVIGGGDWTKGRLVPDLINAIKSNQPIQLRSATATRPWQHVLDCLCGYLLLGKKLLERETSAATAWNFGPGSTSNVPVLKVLKKFERHFQTLRYQRNTESELREAELLYLDSAKANALLGWMPVWDLDRSIDETAAWYKEWLVKGTAITKTQLLQYVEEAKTKYTEPTNH